MTCRPCLEEPPGYLRLVPQDCDDSDDDDRDHHHSDHDHHDPLLLVVVSGIRCVLPMMLLPKLVLQLALGDRGVEGAATLLVGVDWIGVKGGVVGGLRFRGCQLWLWL
jgi:hypothetical protein